MQSAYWADPGRRSENRRLEHGLHGHIRGAFWECAEAQRFASAALVSGMVSDASRSALVEQLLRLGCSTEGLLAE